MRQQAELAVLVAGRPVGLEFAVVSRSLVGAARRRRVAVVPSGGWEPHEPGALPVEHGSLRLGRRLSVNQPSEVYQYETTFRLFLLGTFVVLRRPVEQSQGRQPVRLGLGPSELSGPLLAAVNTLVERFGR